MSEPIDIDTDIASEPAQNGSGLHVARFNPYAGQKRVATTYRLLEGLAARPGHLSDALVDAGWEARQVSANELMQLFLHFRFPETPDEAEPLIQAWGMLKSSPPRRAGT